MDPTDENFAWGDSPIGGGGGATKNGAARAPGGTAAPQPDAVRPEAFEELEAAEAVSDGYFLPKVLNGRSPEEMARKVEADVRDLVEEGWMLMPVD